MKLAGSKFKFCIMVLVWTCAVFQDLAEGPGSQETKQSTSTEPRFAGRLAFRSNDGKLVSIVDATVLVGFDDYQPCAESVQMVKRVKFEVDGSFSFQVDTQVSYARQSDVQSDGSTSEPICGESKTYGCYRFKAKGCEDLIVRYLPESMPDKLQVMSCKGRLGR